MALEGLQSAWGSISASPTLNMIYSAPFYLPKQSLALMQLQMSPYNQDIGFFPGLVLQSLSSLYYSSIPFHSMIVLHNTMCSNN